VGFLLEDLTSFTKPLPRWFHDCHRRFLRHKRRFAGGHASDDSSVDSSDEEDFDWEDEEENLDFRQLRPFVRPFLVLSSSSPSSPSSVTDCVSCFQLDRVFAALRQLHDSGRARFFSLECSDLLVIGDEPSQVEIVITGLSPSQTRANYETEMRENELKRNDGTCFSFLASYVPVVSGIQRRSDSGRSHALTSRLVQSVSKDRGQGGRKSSSSPANCSATSIDCFLSSLDIPGSLHRALDE
jgi:hypothetical protein